MKNHVKNFEEIPINEIHDTRNNIQHRGTMIEKSQAHRYFVIETNYPCISQCNIDAIISLYDGEKKSCMQKVIHVIIPILFFR